VISIVGDDVDVSCVVVDDVEVVSGNFAIVVDCPSVVVVNVVIGIVFDGVGCIVVDVVVVGVVVDDGVVVVDVVVVVVDEGIVVDIDVAHESSGVERKQGHRHALLAE
jgi:hypothetical protein